MQLGAHKAYIKALAENHGDPVRRAQRLYLEEPSFCLGRQRDLEFSLKRDTAEYLGVSYRSVVFAGSAQLGFSPAKGTDFRLGESDLDLAAIDGTLFQELLEHCINNTRSFSDLRGFTQRGGQSSADRLREYITRRGMIPISYLPSSDRVQRIEQFLSSLSERCYGIFGGVTLAVYMSEAMFCWKQDSGIRQLLMRL